MSVTIPNSEYYKLLIYDTSGALVDIPRDLLTFSFDDVVNGGSSVGSFTVPRSFLDTGAVQPGYRVQFFLPDSVDPWWDGRIIDYDPEQLPNIDFEHITVMCEGWSTQLAYAITSDSLNPGVQSNGVNNGTMNADTFLAFLLGRYLDAATFGTSFIASMPIVLDKISFDGTGLNDAIETVIKQVQDNTGNTFEWWVRGVLGDKPALVIQPNQNPNKVTTGRLTPSGTTPTDFIYEFKNSTISNFKVTNSTKGLYNMIALYGGQDPTTKQQVYGAFKDSTSISLFGVRQKKVTNSSILSTLSLANYAAVYLLLYAYPQPQGTFIKIIPSDRARAGRWFQVHVPNIGATASQAIWQYRAVRVNVSLPQGYDKLVQTVSVNAPRPYIDEAYYAAIQQAKNALATSNTGPKGQTGQFCITAGFNWISTALSGGTVSVNLTPAAGLFDSATNTVMPNGPNGDLSYTLALTDSVTAQTGDGRYEVLFALDPLTDFGVLTHSPAFVVVKSANPSPYNHHVLKGWQFTVIGGSIAGDRDLRIIGSVTIGGLPQPTGPTISSACTITAYQTGPTCYGCTLTGTIVLPSNIRDWVDRMELHATPIGAWNSVGCPGLSVISIPLAQLTPGSASYTITTDQAMPCGKAYDVHVVLYDTAGKPYDGGNGVLVQTVLQTFDNSSQPSGPAIATWTFSSAAVRVADWGKATSASVYTDPVIFASYMINESNTPPMAKWSYARIPLLRLHSGASVTDATTYQPQKPIVSIGVGNGWVTPFEDQITPSPGAFYDLAYQIVDAHGNIYPSATTCVWLASNIEVPKAGAAPGGGVGNPVSGVWRPAFIGKWALRGDTTGDTTTDVSDGTQFVHGIMSNTFQKNVNSSGQPLATDFINTVEADPTSAQAGLWVSSLASTYAWSKSAAALNTGLGPIVFEWSFYGTSTNDSALVFNAAGYIGSGPPTSGYLAYIDHTGNLRIYKMISGSWSQIGILTYAGATNLNTAFLHHLKVSVQAVGGTVYITLQFDGSGLLTIPDTSAVNTSGSFGIYSTGTVYTHDFVGKQSIADAQMLMSMKNIDIQTGNIVAGVDFAQTHFNKIFANIGGQVVNAQLAALAVSDTKAQFTTSTPFKQQGSSIRFQFPTVTLYAYISAGSGPYTVQVSNDPTFSAVAQSYTITDPDGTPHTVNFLINASFTSTSRNCYYVLAWDSVNNAIVKVYEATDTVPNTANYNSCFMDNRCPITMNLHIQPSLANTSIATAANVTSGSGGSTKSYGGTLATSYA